MSRRAAVRSTNMAAAECAWHWRAILQPGTTRASSRNAGAQACLPVADHDLRPPRRWLAPPASHGNAQQRRPNLARAAASAAAARIITGECRQAPLRVAGIAAPDRPSPLIRKGIGAEPGARARARAAARAVGAIRAGSISSLAIASISARVASARTPSRPRSTARQRLSPPVLDDSISTVRRAREQVAVARPACAPK